MRKAEKLRIEENEPDYNITQSGLVRMQNELENLKKNVRPRAIEDVRTTLEMGDLSENAGYQEAKARLRRINTRILTLDDRIKKALVIEEGSGKSGKIRLGSTVTISANNKKITYQIVGPQEANPSRGRISHVSPLGSELLGKQAGDRAIVKAGGKEVEYEILEVE